MDTVPCPLNFVPPPLDFPSHPPVITQSDESVKQVAQESKITQKKPRGMFVCDTETKKNFSSIYIQNAQTQKA